MVTLGNITITATDVANSSITGVTAILVYNHANHLTIDVPSGQSINVGCNITMSIAAKDTAGNVIPLFNDPINFSSTDTKALLPTNASTLVNGTAKYSIFFATTGSQTITAIDSSNSSINATTGAQTVALTKFIITPQSLNVTVGQAFNVTVNATDSSGNRLTSYDSTSTLSFNSSDSQATLPATSTSTLTNGTGVFSFTLKTVGNQTLNVTDTVFAVVNGTSDVILANAAATPTPTATATPTPTPTPTSTPKPKSNNDSLIIIVVVVVIIVVIIAALLAIMMRRKSS